VSSVAIGLWYNCPRKVKHRQYIFKTEDSIAPGESTPCSAYLHSERSMKNIHKLDRKMNVVMSFLLRLARASHQAEVASEDSGS
jgi:hypothetical protein